MVQISSILTGVLEFLVCSHNPTLIDYIVLKMSNLGSRKESRTEGDLKTDQIDSE